MNLMVRPMGQTTGSFTKTHRGVQWRAGVFWSGRDTHGIECGTLSAGLRVWPSACGSGSLCIQCQSKEVARGTYFGKMNLMVGIYDGLGRGDATLETTVIIQVEKLVADVRKGTNQKILPRNSQKDGSFGCEDMTQDFMPEYYSNRSCFFEILLALILEIWSSFLETPDLMGDFRQVYFAQRSFLTPPKFRVFPSFCG